MQRRFPLLASLVGSPYFHPKDTPGRLRPRWENGPQHMETCARHRKFDSRPRPRSRPSSPPCWHRASISNAGGTTQASLTKLSPSVGVSAYLFRDKDEDHFFIFSEGNNWTYNGWISDAEFLYVCYKNGKLNLLLFCNGTYLEYRGKKMIGLNRIIRSCELVDFEGRPRVICSETDIVISAEGLGAAFGNRGDDSSENRRGWIPEHVWNLRHPLS